MKTKLGQRIVDSAVILGFLFGCMGMALVLSATATSTNAVPENAFKRKKPSLTKKVIQKHNCKQVYRTPPSWVCDWDGDGGKMQTYVYLTPNVEEMPFMQPPE